MELYNATGKTKTGTEIRATKPIAALVVSGSKKLVDLKNEKISIHVERADQNESIAVKIPLLDFILLSTHGEAAVDTTNGFRALCEISNNGSVELGENESIRVEMEGLTSSESYKIETIEHPLVRNESIEFDRKSMLAGEESRDWDCEDADIVVFDNATAIEQLDIYYDNGVVAKRSLSELQALQHDIDPFIGVGGDLVVPSSLNDKLILALVGVDSFEIQKQSAGIVNMTFLNVYDLDQEV